MYFFTASQMTLGPLVLNTSLLYVLIGIGAGSFLLIRVTKEDKALRKISSDIITNFFFYYFYSFSYGCGLDRR